MSWRNPAFLGQVPLYQGPAGSPFYSAPPAGVYATPSGAPLMSEELTSPDESQIAREYHCYQSPDGSQFISVPFGQRDSYLAAGWVATDYGKCQGPPLHAQPVGTPPGFVMGQRGGGGHGGGGGGGFRGGGGFVSSGFTDFGPDFFPGYPLVPPYAYPPATPPGTTCAWEKDANGNSIYVCRPTPGAPVVSAPPALSYGPVVYPTTSFFPAFY